MNRKIQSWAWLGLLIMGMGIAASVSGVDSPRETCSSKVVFIEDNGLFCPVVGVQDEDPVIRTQSGERQVSGENFRFTIKDGKFPSKGHVVITDSQFNIPSPFERVPANGRVTFRCQEDHQSLFLVTYLIDRRSGEVAYFWFDDMGPVKASAVQTKSRVLDLGPTVLQDWFDWRRYAVEFEFFDGGYPLTKYDETTES